MKKADKRYYRFDVQRNYQFETHDDKGNKTSDITENEWREKVVSETRALIGSVTEAFCIFHDCDINDDGTSKGLHFHSVITFKDAKTQTSAVKLLGASSVHNCQPCDSYVDSLRYLIHISETAVNQMKYIYDVADVFGWFIADDGAVVETTVTDFKQSMSRKNDKKARREQKKVKDSCAVAVMSGQSVVSDVLEVYLEDSHKVGLSAVDYLQDMSLYERSSDVWLQMMTGFYQHNSCPLTTIYISGGGGTGKTTLANALAEKWADSHGVHNVSAPGRSTTFDFVGNYRGERVSIFNELSSAFPVEQFLSIFDTLNAVPVNSRHADKLYFSNYALLTTSVPVEAFIYNLWLPYAKHNAKIPGKVRDSLIRSGADEQMWLCAYQQYLPKMDDKILQIRRRLPVLVNIDDGGFATIYLLDLNFNTSESFAFSAPVHGKEPYSKLRTLPYNVRDIKNIDKQTVDLVQAVCEGVDFYYNMNGLKHPDSFEKPNFDKLLK